MTKKTPKKTVVRRSLHVGPKPTYSYPHAHDDWEDCDEMCTSRLPVIGCWCGAFSKAVNTFHCRFEQVILDGRVTKTRFICYDDDDSDYCMYTTNLVSEAQLRNYWNWVKSMPILDTGLIYQRLLGAGWRPE